MTVSFFAAVVFLQLTNFCVADPGENCAKPLNSSDNNFLHDLLDQNPGLDRLGWSRARNACCWKGVTCYFGGAHLNDTHSTPLCGSTPSTGVRVCNLEVSDQQLVSVPDSIGSLDALRWLDFSRNIIFALPDAVCKLSSVYNLLLPNNNLEVLPSCIGQMNSLQYLNADFNNLKELPESVSLLPLESISVDHNRLEQFPSSILSISSLKQISTAWNPSICEIPDELGNLTLLRGLKMNNCNLTWVTPRLSELRNLTKLIFGDNPGLNGTLNIPAIESLNRVELYNTGLRELKLRHLPNLEVLLVNDNFISGPIVLFACSLEKLSIGNNNITAVLLPLNTSLVNLTHFQAANNHLSELQFLSGSRSNLTVLDVSNNPLRNFDLPIFFSSFGPFPRLQSLFASSSKLNFSIASFLNATKQFGVLNTIDLSDNAGVGGDMSQTAFLSGKISVDAEYYTRFSVSVLILDRTGISMISANLVARHFPALTIFSVVGNPQLDPQFPRDWVALSRLDVRGSFRESVSWTSKPGPPRPARFSRQVIDNGTSSVCPDSVDGGDVAHYVVQLYPAQYDYVLCECMTGYYGTPPNCIPCPESASRDLSVTCAGGNMTVRGGWLRLRLQNNGTEVLPIQCPTDSPVNPCNTTILNQRFASEQEWNEYWRGNQDQTCRDGYTGHMCSKCTGHYYRSGRSCLPCGARSLAWLSPVLSVLIQTILGVKSVLTDNARTGLSRTLTTHVQLLATIPDMTHRLSMAKSEWFRHGSAASSLRFNGLECDKSLHWDGFFAPFILACCFPLIVALACLWVVFFSVLIRPPSRENPLLRRFTVAFVYFWGTMVFGAVSWLFRALNSSTLGSSGRAPIPRLTHAFWVQCDRDFIRSYYVAGALLSGLFILVSFGLYGLIPRPVNHDTRVSRAWVFVRGYLVNPYRDHNHYWEVFQFSRRLLIAAVLALSPYQSSSQSAAMCFILVLALTLQAWRKPFVRQLDNLAETSSIMLLLSTFITCMNTGDDHQGTPGLVTAMLILNISFSVLLFVWFMRETIPRVSKTLKNHFEGIRAPLHQRNENGTD